MDQLLSEVSIQDDPHANKLLAPQHFDRINDIVKTMIHNRRCAGTQFDPNLVNSFLETLSLETVNKGQSLIEQS